MSCFLVPVAEVVVLSGVKLALNFSENKNRVSNIVRSSKENSISSKFGTLQKMLFGGSFLLAIEHFVNGEISFVPPFLTTMNSAEGTSAMLNEMATSGVMMAVLVTAVWALMMIVSHFLKKSSIIKSLKSNLQNQKSKIFALISLSTLASGLMWSVDFVKDGENGSLVLTSLLTFGICASLYGLIHIKIVLSSKK